MNELTLESFFESDKSMIQIFFNESSVNYFFKTANIQSKSFLYYWFFFLKKDDNFELMKELTNNTRFLYKGQEINLLNKSNKIKSILKKWNDDYKINPPDVAIVHPSKGSASLGSTIFNEYPGVIYISVDLLLDDDRLEFSICHELGHIYYNKYLKNNFNNSIKTIDYIKRTSLIKSGLITLYILSIFSLIFNNFFENLTQIVVFIGFLIQFFLILYTDIVSLFSYKQRISNYTQEFFSDAFVYFFLNKKFDVNLIFSREHDYNCFTHPKDEYRKKSLLINYSKNIDNWENIAISNKTLFTDANSYEVNYFFNKIFNKQKEYLTLFFAFSIKKFINNYSKKRRK